MIDKDKIKKAMKNNLSWRNYFVHGEVQDAVILGNNSDLLRKVKACQDLLDEQYEAEAAALDAEADDAKAELLAGAFKKQAIDVKAL